MFETSSGGTLYTSFQKYLCKILFLWDIPTILQFVSTWNILHYNFNRIVTQFFEKKFYTNWPLN